MDHRSSMYPRGKVTKMQEMCLQLHKPFLMGEMDCREMVHRLRSKFIVSEHDEHFIFKAETQREQNGRLVDTIINRTARGFEVYMQVLQDTGHDAAYVKLFRTLENWQEGKEGVKEEEEEEKVPPPVVRASSVPQEEEEEEVDDLQERVDCLSERVDGLDARLTRVEGGHQDEDDRLESDLSDARAEIAKLRADNERLAALVTDRSEELERARKQIEQLEQKILEIEAENEDIKKKFKDQSKKVKDMTDKVKSLQKDLDDHAAQQEDLESQLNVQKMELERQSKQHSKDMDRQARQHKKDMDGLRQEQQDQLQKASRQLQQQMSQMMRNMAVGQAVTGRESRLNNRTSQLPPLSSKAMNKQPRK